MNYYLFFHVLAFQEINVTIPIIREFTEDLKNESSPVFIELKTNITELVMKNNNNTFSFLCICCKALSIAMISTNTLVCFRQRKNI